VADNDVLRRATLGAAIVSNSAAYGDQVIAKVVNRIANNNNVIIADYHTEKY
jgi:uncharacterized protein YlxP (DUF503 family)